MRRASPRSTELGWRRGFGEQNPSLRLARWRALVRAPSGHSRIVLEAISAGGEAKLIGPELLPSLTPGQNLAPVPKLSQSPVDWGWE